MTTCNQTERKGIHANASALADLVHLLCLTPRPWHATSLLVLLGLAASFAESLGLTLILVFVYSAMGQAHVVSEAGGLIGEVMHLSNQYLSGPYYLAAVILALITLRGLLSYINGHFGATVSAKISESAMNQIHRQYLSMSFGCFKKYDQAQLMEVLGTDSWILALAHSSLSRLIVHACSVLVFGAFLFAISWKVSLIALAAYVVMALCIRLLSTPVHNQSKELKTMHRLVGEQMLMTLEGMRTIRAYGLEEEYEKRFAGYAARARGNTITISRLSALINPLTEVGHLAILCTIIVLSSTLNTGFAAVIGCVMLLYRLQPHVRGFEENMMVLTQSEPHLRAVRQMLDTNDKIFPSAGDQRFPGLDQTLAFDDVTFSYRDDGEPALKSVSFDIPVGKNTALIGASGAGKSTIVNLLLRLYAPSSGKIRVDEVSFERLSRRDWLSKLAIAGQDVDLIEGNVIDNIRMARPEASIEDVLEAARIAGVTEFAEHQEYGFESWIGQRGLNLSGGQRQRIGLARAILRNPDFLILDEAFSALDKELENRISSAIDERMQNRTLLRITHRLESAMTADHVVWIENGEVIAQGPPNLIERLMSNHRLAHESA